MSLDPSLLIRELPALLQTALGPVEVCDLTRLKGGYSREMWSFDTIAPGNPPRPWILCGDSESGVVGPDSLDRPTEAALLRRANAHGLPAPAVAAWAGRGESTIASAWFIMERLPGSAAVGPLLRDPWYEQHREALADRKAEILAAIHTLPIGDLLGPPPAATDVARRELNRWKRALADTPNAATPTLRRALDWLAATSPPPPSRVTLVHGDYRTGNLLFDHEGIRGVLDWEMAHLSDPIEDLAWAQLIIWRLDTGRVGALAELDEWPRLYSQHAGVEVEPAALRYWEVLCSLKMSVLAWRAYERTAGGPERQLLHRLFTDIGHELDHQLLTGE